MNKDQIKGVAKNIAGKMQENTGKIIGSKDQEIKGQQKQIVGKMEQTMGDARDAIEKTVKEITKP